LSPARVIGWGFALIVGSVGLGALLLVGALAWGLVEAVTR
jgi:hypothetical protein